MIGIASRLPRERQSAEPPEMIPMAPSGLLTLVAGTLAYMAPDRSHEPFHRLSERSLLFGSELLPNANGYVHRRRLAGREERTFGTDEIP
jgi:hypothetical protein